MRKLTAQTRRRKQYIFPVNLAIRLYCIPRSLIGAAYGNRSNSSTHTAIMSRCSWRSAEALQKLRREQRDIDRKEERARFRRLKTIREWEITGEPPFRSKEYRYPSAGGVKGVGGFLRAADLALHLYDRLTGVLRSGVLVLLNRTSRGKGDLIARRASCRQFR